MKAGTAAASSLAVCGVACCSALLVVSLPVTARAQEERSKQPILKWQATEGCPDEAAVNSEIYRLVGPPLAAEHHQFAANAAVARSNEGKYRAVIRTDEDGRAGTRELDAATCDELAGMTALLIAMMLRPSPGGEGDAPRRAEPPPPVTPTPKAGESQPSPLAPSLQRREPAFTAQVLLGATVAGHTGLIGGPWYAVGPTFGVRHGEARLQASALYSPAKTAHAPLDARAEAELEALSVGGSVCGAVRFERLPLGACLSVEWQRVTGRGTATERLFESSRRTVDFLAIGGGPLLVVPVSNRFSLPVRIEALVPLRRPAFTFDGLGIVAQPSAVWARVSVTSELSLP